MQAPEPVDKNQRVVRLNGLYKGSVRARVWARVRVVRARVVRARVWARVRVGV
jgi:hypothetical protein